MAYRFTPADRGAFKRCRRQWDLGARERQNYEPARPAAAPDLDLAVREALAVYYFPGMWDWQRSVVLPLVLQGLARSLGRQPAGADDLLTAGEGLLRRYFEWAPGVDRFGSDDELLLDEELVAACWAVERFYPGMRVAGTVHNELLAPAGPAPPDAPARRRRFRRPAAGQHQRGLPQHEPSGGGRSLPYARRGAARARPADPAAMTSEGDGEFRRTRVLRDRAELEAMGARLAAEALEMIDPGLPVYPSPAPEHCGSCQFVAPCLAMERGGEVRAVLEAGYRDRGPERVEPGRLGAATWGTGRGAAPPRFDVPG